VCIGKLCSDVRQSTDDVVNSTVSPVRVLSDQSDDEVQHKNGIGFRYLFGKVNVVNFRR